ncbi:polypeptide-transport-associated domain protein ShlB-type, partial [Salmonella enterica subsp. enterica serovar Newport str. CVM 35185]|uniref:ShlB/FhaC/HecB family hemolysin secretion/activation protein n=1 Tax=Salmonella enterica TaxID=28901 RepID=UPI0002694DAF
MQEGFKPCLSARWLWLGILGSLTVPVVLAAPGEESRLQRDAARQFQQQEQQQKARDDALTPKAPDIRLSEKASSPSHLIFPEEKTCFAINQVTLTGQESLPHWVPLTRLADQAVGHCLGVKGINLLMSTLQNRLINHGWVTSRVLAPQQDLSQGTLQLRIVPGTVRDVRLTADSPTYVSLYSAMPAHSGNLLDVRDIEQGLENLQRLPTVTARMALQPGEAPGESDILIERSQSRFWRVGAWVDDTGTESTGRYQGGVMLALDNPTSLSDLFYVTASRDLGFAGKKSTKSLSGHYSVPFGYWLLGITASDYDYHQTIAGRNADILYAGKSRSLDVQLSRVLHRNATSKTTATYDVLARETRNFISNVEIGDQKRRTSAWRLGLTHRHYLGPAMLDIDNAQGVIAAAGEMTVNSQQLNNTEGKLLSDQALALTSLAVNNARGLLQSGARLSLDTQGEQLTNTDSGETGGLVARGDLQLNTGQLDGRQGVILGQNVRLDTHQQAFSHQNGQLMAREGLRLDTGRLDNSAGRIQSGGDAQLDTHGQSLTNRDSGNTGGVLTGGALTLRTGDIDNQRGTLIGRGNTIMTAGSL